MFMVMVSREFLVLSRSWIRLRFVRQYRTCITCDAYRRVVCWLSSMDLVRRASPTAAKYKAPSFTKRLFLSRYRRRRGISPHFRFKAFANDCRGILPEELDVDVPSGLECVECPLIVGGMTVVLRGIHARACHFLTSGGAVHLTGILGRNEGMILTIDVRRRRHEVCLR